MFVGCGEPQLLLHVLKDSGSINHSNIDNADEMSLSLVQRINECNIGGSKKVIKINMCGMQPIVEGCTCYYIFQCDPGLSCLAPLQAVFYFLC